MSWKQKNSNKFGSQVEVILEEPKLYPPINITKPVMNTGVDGEYPNDQDLISITIEMKTKKYYYNVDKEEPEMLKYSMNYYKQTTNELNFNNLKFLPSELLGTRTTNVKVVGEIKDNIESEESESNNSERDEMVVESEDSDNDYGVDHYDDDLDAFGDDGD